MADASPDTFRIASHSPGAAPSVALPASPPSDARSARARLEQVKHDAVNAALMSALMQNELRKARIAMGLPAEEECDAPAAADERRPFAVVGRLGGGDAQGAGWTADRQRAFLGHLAECASVTHACRLVGLSKQSAYALRARTPRSVFAILWNVAVRQGRRRLYDEALERAMAGRVVAVWHRGEEVGTRQVHNDRLLMFLLAHEPPAVHPVLDDRQLAELWPSLMAEVDAVLPPSAALARIVDDVAQDTNGNDRG